MDFSIFETKRSKSTSSPDSEAFFLIFLALVRFLTLAPDSSVLKFEKKSIYFIKFFEEQQHALKDEEWWQDKMYFKSKTYSDNLDLSGKMVVHKDLFHRIQVGLS